MPNLTKKFTRDSLKRGNPAAAAAAGGAAGLTSSTSAATSVDLSKAQIIQMEMARARAKSLRTFDRAKQRTVGAVVGMTTTTTTSSAMHHHPNYQYNEQQHPLSPTAPAPAPVAADDQSQAEIITSMSSLTWAPSMSMDMTSVHHRRQQQQQLHHHHSLPSSSNTDEYLHPQQRRTTNSRQPVSSSTTIRNSDQRQYHDDHHHNNRMGPVVTSSRSPTEQQHYQHRGRHHRRPEEAEEVVTATIDVQKVYDQWDKKKVYEQQRNNHTTTTTTTAEYGTTMHTRNSESRDPPPSPSVSSSRANEYGGMSEAGLATTTVDAMSPQVSSSSKTRSRSRQPSSSSTSRRAKSRDHAGSGTSAAGRSKRSTSVSSSNRKRSSSTSSTRRSSSASTTAGTLSTSNNNNNNNVCTVPRSQNNAVTLDVQADEFSGHRNKENHRTAAETVVTPTTTTSIHPSGSSDSMDGDNYQRRHTSKNTTARLTNNDSVDDMQQQNSNRSNSGSSSSSNILTPQDKEIANMVTNNQISLSTAMGTLASVQRGRSHTYDSQSQQRTTTTTTSSSSPIIDGKSEQSLMVSSHGKKSSTPQQPSSDGPSPKTAIEAARMSLRPTIHRSTSNLSLSSSVHSESIQSMASNLIPSHHHQQQQHHHTMGTTKSARIMKIDDHKLSQSRVNESRSPSSANKNVASSSTMSNNTAATFTQTMSNSSNSNIAQTITKVSSTVTPENKADVVVPRYKNNSHQPYHPQRRPVRSLSLLGYVRLAIWYTLKTILWTVPKGLVLAIVYCFRRSRRWTPYRKTVLITGATTAIGSETAKQLAMVGARLALVDSNRMEELEALAHECRELGSSKALCYAADLTQSTSTGLALQQAAKDFNNVFDVVILNGTIKAQGCYFEEIRDATQMEQMLKHNVLSCCHALHYVLQHIPKTSNSRIVVLSSTAGLVGSPYQTMYSATHHALTGFCQSLRMELQDSYSVGKAPKVCLVSFPDLASGSTSITGVGATAAVGNKLYHQNPNDRILDMGATLPPAKGYSWVGIPLQRAVHDLIQAIASGKRDFGAPTYLTMWRTMYAWIPGLVDWAVFQHAQETHYRPLAEDSNTLPHQTHNFAKKGNSAATSSGSGTKQQLRQRPSNVSNDTW